VLILGESRAQISPDTETCINCHENYTPGIFEDWLRSKHASTTPRQALSKPILEREISNTPPDELMDIAVGCFECHSLNAEKHEDNFEHMGFNINVIVSPDDCLTCHEIEVLEYYKSVKSKAIENLDENPVYHLLVETSTQTYEYGSDLQGLGSSENTQAETCYYCHGTKIEVNGLKQLDGDLSIMVPDLKGWPNHGVGRLNPDGSKGTCTACHPRHSFSIEIARDPKTCAQCHIEPDVPAYNVWKESKHGNIFESESKKYNMDSVPWIPGKDFKSPPCAACHASLLTNANGEIIERTHNLDSRIYVRIFGIYGHPQPKEGSTWEIVNDDGLPLPATLTGEPASEFLIDNVEQEKRRNQFIKICGECHSTDYAQNHFNKLDQTVNETNFMTIQATKILLDS